MRKAAGENADDDARMTYVPGMQQDMGGGNHVAWELHVALLEFTARGLQMLLAENKVES